MLFLNLHSSDFFFVQVQMCCPFFFFFFLFSLTFRLANIPHPAPCRSLSGVTWSCAECAAGLGCQRGAGPGPAVPTAGSSPTPELSLGGGGGFGSSGAGSTRWEGGLSSLVSHFSYSSSLMCLLPSCPQFAPVSPPVSPCPPFLRRQGVGSPPQAWPVGLCRKDPRAQLSGAARPLGVIASLRFVALPLEPVPCLVLIQQRGDCTGQRPLGRSHGGCVGARGRHASLPPLPSPCPPPATE